MTERQRTHSAAGRGAASTRSGLTRLQSESWRLLWREFLATPDAVAEYEAWETRRRDARPALLSLLRRFLDARLSLPEFRERLDAGTKTTWDVFGLRGLSGAGFLNRLAKQVRDTGALARAFRAILPAPDEGDVDDLRGALAVLRQAVGPQQAGVSALQPLRATFFVTLWWHLQEPDRWPGFHPSAREALRAEEGLYAPRGDAPADYFAFRDAFAALTATLAISPSQLEYLCWWRQQRAGGEDAESYYEPSRLRARRSPAGTRPGDETDSARTAPADAAASSATRGPGGRPRERSRPVPVVREGLADTPADRPTPRVARPGHTHVQWILGSLGKRLGCRVWIAANDRARLHEGEPLGALSIHRLPPLGVDPKAQRLVSLIDVVWLQGGNEVAAAFEVEHTTSIYSGLLRLGDLAALSPNLSFPLYIVAPATRLERVRRELARPTFRALGLDRRCAFFASEALVSAADAIMRWGQGPRAIERLASRLTSVADSADYGSPAAAID